MSGQTRILTVNCGDDTACGCRQQANIGALTRNRGIVPHSVRTNLRVTETRTEQYQGREHLVVPVVMARAGVVMNGALTLLEELFPDAWNGVPVTVGHPELPQDGGFTTANSPATLETWAVGQIFNSRIEDNALKGEAWIDVVRANNVRPGLIEELTGASAAMDVSTGYFSRDEKRHGSSNGRQYDRVAKDLLPDHLALLPGDTGACSWEDGCGVRVNKERSSMSDTKDKLLAAFNTLKDAVLGATNARGADDDYRQIVADLVSSDKTPFLPDDTESLNYMSRDTLMAMRDTFLPAAVAKGKKNNQEAEGAQPVTTEPAGAGSGLPSTVGELNTLIANAVTAALAPITTQLSTNAEAIKTATLSESQVAALATAERITANHRADLVTRVTTNSKITKEQAEAMPLAQLEVVANGIVPAADFSGRPSPHVIAANAEGDEELEAMNGGGIDALITANAAERGTLKVVK